MRCRWLNSLRRSHIFRRFRHAPLYGYSRPLGTPSLTPTPLPSPMPAPDAGSLLLLLFQLLGGRR